MIQLFRSQELGRELASMIDGAEHSIRLDMYQLSPKTTTAHAMLRTLWHALEAAPARGIRCTAILGASLMAAPGSMSADRAREQLSEAGWLALCDRSARVMHQKSLVIDCTKTLIGSHNWTGAALAANTEASVLIADEALAVRMAATHDERLDDLIRMDDAALGAYRAWAARLI